MSITTMVVIKDLYKQYSDKIAIQDISFKLKPGTVTGFLGPNGAGKTTTLKILTGVLKPDGGTVVYDGKDIDKDWLLVKNQIGYLPEHNALYTNLRVDEYLSYCLSLYSASVPSGYIEKVIHDTGIESVMSEKIGKLSKGYKQRVGIARVLLPNPKYVFLDEPTTGLDPNQKDNILKLIKSTSKNKAVLFSSHILAEVEAIADEVVIINSGEIVAQGETTKLLTESTGSIVTVELKAPKKEVINQINKIKGVTNISLEGKDKSFNTYLVQADDPQDLCLQVFTLAVSNNWQLRQLKTETRGLEDIFKQLTSKK